MAAPRGESDPPVTSIQLRRALAGDAESLDWIIDHLHPLLLAQAQYRLRALDGVCEPEDLVQQAWLVSLPRLSDLEPRNGRFTPVLLRFLSSTLLRLTNGLLSREIRRGGRAERAPESASPDALAARVTNVVNDATRRESRQAVHDAIAALPGTDREILILKGIEQIPYGVLGAQLGASEGALRVRFHRALEKLRGALPPDIVDELIDPAP